MLSFNGEPVKIIRSFFSSEEDAYGIQKIITDEIESSAVIGFVQASLEEKAYGIQDMTRLKLFFPNGTEIFPQDRFIVRGSEWEKDGMSVNIDSSVYTTPFIHSMPVIVQVKQVKGNAGQEENHGEA